MMSLIDNIKFSFLYIELYSMGKNWEFPQSMIPYNILRYIVKGEALFYINDEIVKVKENQIVYIPKGCNMSCKSISDTFEFFSVRFTTLVSSEVYDVLGKVYGIPRILHNQGEDVYFREMYKWLHEKIVAKKCFIEGNLNLLIGSLSMRAENNILEDPLSLENAKANMDNMDIIKEMEVSLNKQNIDPRIRFVSYHIISNPTENYTPEKMASMIGLSKQRFSSLFKKSMGKPPMEYLKEIRLTTAARFLLIGNKSISDIAYDVGYKDPNYFIREFKSAFGVTPNKYRKVNRDG